MCGATNLLSFGTVLQVSGNVESPTALVRWWWGCQMPVTVPLEELELIEEFICDVHAMQT